MESDMINLTVQQQSIKEEMLNGTSQHVAVVARAGTGKTSTILEVVDALATAYPHLEILVCCFGKDIKKEIEAKLRVRGHDWRKCQASTTHSMGWQLVKWAFKLDENAIDEGKVRALCWAQGNRDDKDMEEATRRNPAITFKRSIYSTHCSAIVSLVQYAKLEGVGYFEDAPIEDPNTWLEIADHFDLDSFDERGPEEIIPAAQYIYQMSLAQTDRVDYADMVLFPLIHGLNVRFTKDVIFIDEAQDTSRARQELIKRFLKPNGRMVVVGDDRQAIMGFAGAAATAMEDLIEYFSAKTMPLTMTWRCAKSIVRKAQTIVPDIEAPDTAAEGLVDYLPAMPEAYEPTQVVLCRNSAPLMELAYDLVGRRVPFKVEGRDFGKSLLKLINRWETVKTIGDYLVQLRHYKDAEVAKAEAKGNKRKVQSIEDRCGCVEVLCEIAMKEKETASLDGVRALINELFADDVVKQGVLTLCTYHRSKGREWGAAILMEHDYYCPSAYARQPWERRQEQNLAYVAYTRAKHALIITARQKPWTM